MPKFCNNGHQMEDSWDTCPYCQRTGFQNPSGAAANLAKTRLEFDPAPPPPPVGGGMGAPGSARKTVLLAGGRPKGELAGWMVIMDGDQKGEDFRIREGQNSLGSNPDSDVHVKDVAVSGKHAVLRCRDKKFLLTDLDSSNGTYLNSSTEPISMEELHDNDIVRIGNTTLKVKIL